MLTSRPSLEQPDDDLLDEFQGEQSAIAPRRLAMRRLLAEYAGLVELIVTEDNGPDGPPALALADGSLILWQLESETDAFRSASLQAFQAHLEAARTAGVPVASYISKSAGRDVLNALRVFHCPYEIANCDRNCPGRARPRPHYIAPDCIGTERLTDADLFARRLAPGQRSALFGSASPILREYAPAHAIRFFYLHVGAEVARVEIPAWVGDDADLLARVHTLCYDQAQKGDGYPVALAEAHEQAIVRGVERDAFFRLMERAFVTSRLPLAGTQKAASKRARRV